VKRNNIIDTVKLKYLCLLVVSLFLMGFASSVTAQQKSFYPSSYAGPLWAAGDETWLYIVLYQPIEDEAGFQIYARKIIDDKFRSGGRYQGRPTQTAVYDNRLLVFLAGGRSQSYDLHSATRTEARLKAPWLCLDVAVADKNVYILAQAQQSARVKVLPSLSDADLSVGQIEIFPEANQPAPLDRKDNLNPDNTAGAIRVNPGDYFLLQRGKDQQWYSLTSEPLPIDDWYQPSMAVHHGVIYLFGIDTSPRQALMHCQWENQIVSEPQALPLQSVAALSVMNVNQQIRLVVAVQDDDQYAPAEQYTSLPPIHYIMVWPTQGGWQFSARLEKSPGEILTTTPDKVRFTVCGQNLGAFEWLSEQQVNFGIYSPTGNLVQDLTHPITGVSEKPSQVLQWFFGGQVGLVCMIVTLFLIYVRRTEAFGPSSTLPDYIVLAPFMRRIAAFLLDTIGPFLIALALFPEVLQKMRTDTSLLEQTQMLVEDAQLLKFAATFFFILIGYMTISELVLAATPGKFALGLTILDNKVIPATPWQILIRNLFRLLEFHTGILALLLILMTRRRQRLGDLFGHTVVVLKTPDLLERITQNMTDIVDAYSDSDKNHPDL
jgi:uncharacterized RDD family membrane protein YckC